MSESGRRFCENRGTGINQTTNFCPNCGAAQRPDPEVPTSLPPMTPEPGRIPTSDVPNVPPPPQEPQEPQRSWLSTTVVVLVLLIVLVIMARRCGGATQAKSSSGGATTVPERTTPQRATEEKAKATKDTGPGFGDGTHQVGSDIQPGTYRTREGSNGCYYARLGGFGGGVEDIIANDNADGPAVVTIEPTDAGFESRRYGRWTQDLSAITNSTTSFEDGINIVGTDIEPGTYRSSGSSGCYYARLSGFGGPMDDLITNGITDAPAVVEIAPTDAGFQSKRCGTWTKIG